MNCPKCSAEARDIARFCPRCHATLRYDCPACHHEQRHGGTCDKCGVDFLKYISAVVAVKQAEADADHTRLEQRSTFLKNVLLIPFNMGIPLIRSLLGGPRKDSRL
jgi:Double zinc ribbon